MNDIISTAKAARASLGARPRSRSASLRRDLLVAHEDLLVQLRTELACRSGFESSPTKLLAMIAQHEQAAATLRGQARPRASTAVRARPAAREPHSRRGNRVSGHS